MNIPRGRPTRLNKAMIDKIAKVIERGNYIDTACQSVGIARSILYDALNKADSLYKYLGDLEIDSLIETFEKSKSDDGLFNSTVVSDHALNQYEVWSLYLHYRIKKAEAESEIEDLSVIDKAKLTYWQAAAWKLERRHADRWAEKNQMAVTVVQGLRIREDIQAELDKSDDPIVTVKEITTPSS